jgi:mannose-1-phosphate guanylyltransferase
LIHPRNTAATIAFAAFASAPDDLLIVTPSDHIVEMQTCMSNLKAKSIKQVMVTLLPSVSKQRKLDMVTLNEAE